MTVSFFRKCAKAHQVVVVVVDVDNVVVDVVGGHQKNGLFGRSHGFAARQKRSRAQVGVGRSSPKVVDAPASGGGAAFGVRLFKGCRGDFHVAFAKSVDDRNEVGATVAQGRHYADGAFTALTRRTKTTEMCMFRLIRPDIEPNIR